MIEFKAFDAKKFELFQSEIKQHIDSLLSEYLASLDIVSERLNEAIRYSVLSGGKRIRPLLMYGVCAALGGRKELIDSAAVSVELIHAYSLVHDDLPAMDDDDMRRGMPTCHKAFDEATAILVGDALQSMAFEVLSDANGQLFHHMEAEMRVALISGLAQAAGVSGMVAGQSLDLSAEGGWITLTELEKIHKNKTGRLIEAAIQMAVIASGQQGTQSEVSLKRFAEVIGLAFQIQDDILDVTGSTHLLGKKVGADQGKNKATFPSILGIDAARERLVRLYEEMMAVLSDFGEEADLLRAISRYTVYRVS